MKPFKEFINEKNKEFTITRAPGSGPYNYYSARNHDDGHDLNSAKTFTHPKQVEKHLQKNYPGCKINSIKE